MRIQAAMVAAIACALIVSSASSGLTQASSHPTLARFAGAYRNPLEDGGQARIRGAIEAVVVSMAPLRQNVARRRLVASDPPIPRISITPSGEGLVIDYTHGRRNQTPRLGTFADNPSAGGGRVDVMHEVVGDRIRETYRENRGGAVNLLALSADGSQLLLEVTIRSPHLPGPIRYELAFDRVR